MDLFSEREGIRPSKLELQEKSIDKQLRVRLWNVIYILFYKKQHIHLSTIPDIDILTTQIWEKILKKTADEVPNRTDHEAAWIKEYAFNCNWNEFYDLIDLIPSIIPQERSQWIENFTSYCNTILKEESAAWRFVGGRLCKITSEEEKLALEEALSQIDHLKPVKIHIIQAII